MASWGREVEMECRGAAEEVKLTALGGGFLRGMRRGEGQLPEQVDGGAIPATANTGRGLDEQMEGTAVRTVWGTWRYL